MKATVWKLATLGRERALRGRWLWQARLCKVMALVLGASLCLGLVSCRFFEKGKHEEQRGSASSPATAKSHQYTLRFEDGPSLTIERNGDKLSITSQNEQWGTLKLSSDRVKLDQGGQEAAKAKRKDYGFKVYDGEREVFKVKRRASGYEVRRADDAELGSITTEGGQIGTESLVLESSGGASTLKRAGKTLVSLRGRMRPLALLLLGVTEATLPQRLVMASIVDEGIVP